MSAKIFGGMLLSCGLEEKRGYEVAGPRVSIFGVSALMRFQMDV